MIRYIGIAAGLTFAFYYWAKRYWRKFLKKASEMKDDDISE